MNRPRTAILDGDILAYRAAFWADSEGPEWLELRMADDLKRWTPEGVDEVIVALSCRRDDNFRRDYYPDYKAHRNERPSPETLPDALAWLNDNATCLRKPRIEADDLIGMWQSGGKAIGVTIDKDLKQVPGWNWYPQVDPAEPRAEIMYTSLEDADKAFYKQWITGDSTDNIPGVWKVGPAKAEKMMAETLPQNWEALVLSLYERRPTKEGGAYTLDDAINQGVCVRILRDGEDVLPWQVSRFSPRDGD
jgi:hypothetical protein